MSTLRLHSREPEDTLEARLAVILQQLIEGAVTDETYRDLVVLAHEVIVSMAKGGECTHRTIGTDNLIDAVRRAGDTYKSDVLNSIQPQPVRRLFTYIHRQIVERKNRDAINALIAEKELTCTRCATWHNLPATGMKCSCIQKICGFREVYAESPACENIDPIYDEDKAPTSKDEGRVEG